jgi:hypothetical protein
MQALLLNKLLLLNKKLQPQLAQRLMQLVLHPPQLKMRQKRKDLQIMLLN